MIIPEWKRVLRHAWSVRLALLAGFFSGVEGVLPLFTDKFPRGLFALLSMFFGMASAVARLILQKKMRNYGDD